MNIQIFFSIVLVFLILLNLILIAKKHKDRIHKRS